MKDCKNSYEKLMIKDYADFDDFIDALIENFNWLISPRNNTKINMISIYARKEFLCRILNSKDIRRDFVNADFAFELAQDMDCIDDGHLAELYFSRRGNLGIGQIDSCENCFIANEISFMHQEDCPQWLVNAGLGEYASQTVLFGLETDNEEPEEIISSNSRLIIRGENSDDECCCCDCNYLTDDTECCDEKTEFTKMTGDVAVAILDELENVRDEVNKAVDEAIQNVSKLLVKG